MLDFPEEDVDALHRDDAAARLAESRRRWTRCSRKSRQGSLLRSGIHVVLAGRPNVGKSSLLNRLAGEERAIVTPIPGTTRDALREPILIEGVPLVVVDTAGLRESRDEIERLGMRAHAARARARGSGDRRVRGRTRGSDELAGPAGGACAHRRLQQDRSRAAAFAPPAGRARAFSAKTGAGLEALRQAILEAAGLGRRPANRCSSPASAICAR